MKSFPFPVILAASATLIALPFSFAAAALLAVTTGLGAIICADYPQRYRGLRVPRRQTAKRIVFRAPPLVVAVEPNRLAA